MCSSSLWCTFDKDALTELTKGSCTTAVSATASASATAAVDVTTSSDIITTDIGLSSFEDTTTATDTATASTPRSRPYASLTDSTGAQAAWAKTLMILINSRKASKGLAASGLRGDGCSSHSQLVDTMIKRYRMMMRAGTADIASQSLDYWLGHDLTTNDVANKSWDLYVQRVSVFALAATRRDVDNPPQGQERALSPGLLETVSPSSSSLKRSLLVHLLKVILRMCGHEYDAIRATAANTYAILKFHFSSYLFFKLLKPLLIRATIVGTPYPVIAGALSLMLTFRELLQKRWHITDGFLRYTHSHQTLTYFNPKFLLLHSPPNSTNHPQLNPI